MVDRISEHELRQMYSGDQLSMREIAKEVGVSQSTICDWMKEYSIESRTRSESHLINTLKPSKEELQRMYWNEIMSMAEIAKNIGVYPNTVHIWMKEYNINTRTNLESLSVNTLKPSKEVLTEMYWDHEMSQSKIAEHIGVSQETVRYWMQKYGIKSRTLSESLIGENNGNWNGGTSFEPYCNKFNSKFKESVCERDDFTCQLCGYEQKLGGQKLDVHHIHYDRGNCYPDVVALCRSCHAKINGDRDYWEQYFSDQLIERGLLNWSM